MSPLDATADKNLRLALVDEVYCNKHGYDWLAEVSELRDRYETTRTPCANRFGGTWAYGQVATRR